MIVDAHHHLWRLDDSFVGWFRPEHEPIRRDCGIDELLPLLRASGVGRTVLIQSAASTRETAMLLEIAARNPIIGGVVGWVDLARPDHLPILEQWCDVPLFKGVRPMISHGLADGWLLSAQIAPAVALLRRNIRRFDALVRTRHLGELCAFADQHPDLGIVLDHAAKPDLRLAVAGQEYAAWSRAVAEVAHRPNVCCKISGFLPLAPQMCTRSDLAPVLDHLLECFGPGRLMWGSDWPLVTLSCTYGRWKALAAEHFGANCSAEVFGASASRFYRLPDE